MAKYNRPNGKLFGSSATNIGVFGSGQQNETPTTSTDPNTINNLGTHWEDGWNGAVVSQAPYTAPYVEDMNAVNYVNSYNSAYLLQRGIAEYSATEEYQKDSLCTYNGEIWMCKLDNTVGQTPAEGTYWHLQGEVPIMNDKEILVGAVGGTPSVVATDNQGDIEASSSGLNIKANTIVNADINSSAAIAESKLSLAYSTSSLNSTISGHISDTGNPHSVTKAQVLSGDPIVNADVDASAAIEESKLDLDYATDTLNTNIGNVSTNLGNHTGDKNNPHDTEISNLHDVTISTLQDGDVISYDLLNDTWKNGQPAGGALSTLSDATITSPTDKQLVQYDYANSKWVNSSDVWDTLTANDVAYVGATPQGHTIDGSNNVTMLATDNKHQVLTATDGYNIILPSTGIKAGEKFIFDFSGSFSYFPTTSIVFYVGATVFVYCHTNFFRYKFTALVDNPSTTTDWLFEYELQKQPYSIASNRPFPYYEDWMVEYTTTTSGTVWSKTSSTLFTIPNGVYDVVLRVSIVGGSWDGNNDWWFAGTNTTTGRVLQGNDGQSICITMCKSMQTCTSASLPLGGGSTNAYSALPTMMNALFSNTKRSMNIGGYFALRPSSSGHMEVRIHQCYKLMAPVFASDIT